MFFYPLAIKWI